MDTAWIALIGTLFAGVGLKSLDRIFSRGERKTNEATALRDELRKEGEALKKEALELREEIRQVEKDLDLWKEKYFTLLGEYMEIKNQIQDAATPSRERW